MTLKAQKILLLFLLSIYSIYLLLCFLSFPVADDFIFSLFLKKGEFQLAGMFSYFRNSWNGRYTSHFFCLIQPYELFGLSGYRLALSMTLVILFLSTFFCLKTLLKPDIQTLCVMLISTWFLLLFLHIMPGAEETIYWWSGALGYTWAIIFHALWLIVFIKWSETKIHKWANTLLISIISIIVCGFTEISLVITIMLFFFLMIIPSIHLKKFDRHQLVIILSLLSASIFILSAPGNSIRISFFPEGQSITSALVIAFESLVKLNGIVIQSAPFILTIILIFPFIRIEQLNVCLKNLLTIHPALFVLAWQSLLFTAFFVQSWAMGINPPMRIYNYLLFFWLSGFLFLLFNLKQHFSGKKSLPMSPLKGKVLYTLVLITISSMFLDFKKPPGEPVVFGGNMPAAIYDLTHNFLPFRKELLNRNNDIQHQLQSGADTIILQPLKHKPEVVFYLDISEDPDYFVNYIMAETLGVKIVKLTDHHDGQTIQNNF
jgi:hypothetical protein